VKKKFFLASIGIVVLLVLGSLLLREKLPVSSPEAAGLIWQECQTEEYLSSWQQAELCLGVNEKDQDVEDGFSSSKRTDYDDYWLQIGQDIYQTKRLGGFLSFDVYLLTKNNWPISLQLGQFTAHSPNIGLYDVAGKAAWEFVTLDKPTIIYDGRNLRQRYNLDQAHSPYSLNGKLVFLAQQDDNYFVVYDGKRLTPDYEDIVHAYCCETSMYSPVVHQGFYFFYANRDGKRTFMMLTSSEK
jgi:hypothetical protein